LASEKEPTTEGKYHAAAGKKAVLQAAARIEEV
jgi:hypothetical protein